MGVLLHKGLVKFLSEQGIYDVLEEVEVKRKIGEWTVKGRVDAWLVKEDGEEIIVEIKTSRRDVGIPYQHHIEQLKLYLWLTKVRKGLLVYITPDRITEYEVNTPATDEEVMMYIEDFVKKARVPRFDWECKLCMWNNICNRKIV